MMILVKMTLVPYQRINGLVTCFIVAPSSYQDSFVVWSSVGPTSVLSSHFHCIGAKLPPESQHARPVYSLLAQHQRQAFENRWNFHRSHEPSTHCGWSDPSLFLYQLISNGWCQLMIEAISHTPLTVLPDNKVHGANMGPIWGQQDPGGPRVGPMNFAVWADTH